VCGKFFWHVGVCHCLPENGRLLKHCLRMVDRSTFSGTSMEKGGAGILAKERLLRKEIHRSVSKRHRSHGQIVHVDHLAIITVAKLVMDLAVDAIADLANRPVAHGYVEAAGMGTAETLFRKIT